MTNKTKPILVTGANGYIASWIVKYLLEDGFYVRASVRNARKTESYQHLLDIASKCNGKLEIMEANLLKNDSFDKLVEGCELVMHTASPFTLDIKDAQKDLVNPALDGTINVLNSVNNSSSVKRVVLTSSVASVFGDSADIEKTKNNIFTEEHWNESSRLDYNPYSFSKVEAEKAAWKMNKAQTKWDLVTINPGFVFGPSLAPNSQSESIKMMSDFINGRMAFGVPELYFAMVDVRDVAIAHIKAGFTPAANGRNLVVAGSESMGFMAKIIKNKLGKKAKISTHFVPKFILKLVGPTQGLTREHINKNVGCKINVDNTKSINELGIQYRPLTLTIEEHIDQLTNKKI